MRNRLTSGVNWILHGTVDSRLRATWRILIAVSITFVGAFVGGLVVQRVELSELVVPLVGHLFAVIAVLVALVVMARQIDHRPVSEYGFTPSRTWMLDVLVGTFVGIGLVGFAFVLSYQRGTVNVLHVLSAGSASSFVFGIGVVVVGWIFVGFWEETLFRGLFLSNAAEGLATRGLSRSTAVFGAWLSSSLVYGFIHGPLGSNPDSVSLLYALIMTSVMGGLFGIAYVISGELAVPIGLHTGINFAEHTLFLGPPDGVAPAVLRVEHAITGGHVQFQSMNPLVIVPVFVVGYILIAGWFYLREGTVSLNVHSRQHQLS